MAMPETVKIVRNGNAAPATRTQFQVVCDMSHRASRFKVWSLETSLTNICTQITHIRSMENWMQICFASYGILIVF